MKIVLLLFMSLFTIVSSSDSKQNYLENVNNAYEYYTYEENQTTYYDIVLVQGIINDEFTYGIYFYSFSSREYNVVLSLDNKLYYPKTTSRGDSEVIALKLDSNKTYQVLVFNKENIQQFPNMDLTLINKDKDSFLNSDNLITGKNAGIKLSKLSSNNRNGFNIKDIFLYASISIIIICLIVILIYYKKKQGMFKEDNRAKDIFKYNDYIRDTAAEDFDYEDDFNIDDYDYRIDELEEEPKQIYNRYGRLEDDELSGFNIKEYLESINYKTDYSLANEDEKNLIMIELMKLKDSGKITYDDYLEETLKLWKK